MRKNQQGYSLVELLVVLAILGIILAIVIPNLLDAKDRAKQRATIAELHNWGTALSAFEADNNRFPTPGPGADEVADVVPQLLSFTSNPLAITDKWGYQFHYHEGPGAYTIASYGKLNAPGVMCDQNNWFDFQCDLVLADGIFVGTP